MGRRIPAYDHNNLSLIYPLLHFSFLAATLFSTIAIIAALCGVRRRKKSSRHHSSHPSSSDPQHTAKDMDARSHQAETSPETENDEMQRNELPLPTALQQPGESASNMKKETSGRRLSFSLSLKVPRNLSVAKGDGDGRKKEKSKTEDSVWMKTIILGDRCVPDEGDDGVIYEQKGKKISAYHPRNNSSNSISRQTSSVDHDAVSGPNIHKQNINQKHM